MVTPFQKYRCRVCNAEFFAEPPMDQPDAGGRPKCPKCGSADTRQLRAGHRQASPYDRGAGGCCSAGSSE